MDRSRRQHTLQAAKEIGHGWGGQKARPQPAGQQQEGKPTGLGRKLGERLEERSRGRLEKRLGERLGERLGWRLED